MVVVQFDGVVCVLTLVLWRDHLSFCTKNSNMGCAIVRIRPLSPWLNALSPVFDALSADTASRASMNGAITTLNTPWNMCWLVPPMNWVTAKVEKPDLNRLSNPISRMTLYQSLCTRARRHFTPFWLRKGTNVTKRRAIRKVFNLSFGLFSPKITHFCRIWWVWRRLRHYRCSLFLNSLATIIRLCRWGKSYSRKCPSNTVFKVNMI